LSCSSSSGPCIVEKKKKKSSIKSFLTVDENLVKENAALRQRVQELEQQIEQLKKGVCDSILCPFFLILFIVDQTLRRGLTTMGLGVIAARDVLKTK